MIRNIRSRPVDYGKPIPITRNVGDLAKLKGEDRLDPNEASSLQTEFFHHTKVHNPLNRKTIVVPTTVVHSSAQATDALSAWQRPTHFIRFAIQRDYCSGIRFPSDRDREKERHKRRRDKDNRHAPIAAAAAAADQPNSFHTQQQPYGFGSPSDPCRVDVLYDMLREDEEWLQHYNHTEGEGEGGGQEEPRLTEEDFVRIMDHLEKRQRNHPQLPVAGNQEFLLQVQRELNRHRDEKSAIKAKPLHNVFMYWLSRRQARKAPLLRVFWPRAATNDPNPLGTFRPRPGSSRMSLRRPRRGAGDQVVERCATLQADLDKADALIKLTKQREEKKMLAADLAQWEFEQARQELIDPSYTHPEWTKRRDQVKAKIAVRLPRGVGRKRPRHEAFPRDGLHLAVPTAPGPADASAQEVTSLGVSRGEVAAAADGRGADHGDGLPAFTMRSRLRRGRGGRMWLDRFRMTPVGEPPPTAAASAEDAEAWPAPSGAIDLYGKRAKDRWVREPFCDIETDVSIFEPPMATPAEFDGYPSASWHSMGAPVSCHQLRRREKHSGLGLRPRRDHEAEEERAARLKAELGASYSFFNKAVADVVMDAAAASSDCSPPGCHSHNPLGHVTSDSSTSTKPSLSYPPTHPSAHTNTDSNNSNGLYVNGHNKSHSNNHTNTNGYMPMPSMQPSRSPSSSPRSVDSPHHKHHHHHHHHGPHAAMYDPLLVNGHGGGVGCGGQVMHINRAYGNGRPMK